MITTLIIDDKSCELKLKNEVLYVHRENRKPCSIAIRYLEQISILCDLNLSSQMIRKLSHAGINFVLMNPRHLNEITFCLSPFNQNYERKSKQYQITQNKPQSLQLARELMKAKILTQYQQIKKFYTLKSHKSSFLSHYKQQLAPLFKKMNTANQSELLGLEGYSTQLYFEYFIPLFDEKWQFKNRNRRPPKDPINALLSLSYTLLISDCAFALNKAGLDSAFGFYHQISYGRQSLACDLAEIYRVRIDQIVYDMIESELITLDHFEYKLSACLLNKKGRSLFFPEYQRRMKIIKKAIQKTVYQWIRLYSEAQNA